MSLGIGSYFTEDNIAALDAITNDAANKAKLKGQDLGQDAFLNLMMTQLAHQDPLSPMDNQEMIAQMAQFSSVEQMGLVNEGVQKTVEQNDMMLDALLMLADASGNANNTTQIETLIEKTDRNNELNTNILNELIKLNKAMEAYTG